MASTVNIRNQERIAAVTLKNETAIESKNTKGIAKFRTRRYLDVPGSRLSLIEIRPLVAYHHIEPSKSLGIARETAYNTTANCRLPYSPSKDVGKGTKEMLNRNNKFSHMSVLS